jgi:hypothetical protein
MLGSYPQFPAMSPQQQQVQFALQQQMRQRQAMMQQMQQMQMRYRVAGNNPQGVGMFKLQQMPIRRARSPSPEDLPTPPDEYDLSESEHDSEGSDGEEGGSVPFVDGDDDWRPGMKKSRKASEVCLGLFTQLTTKVDEGRRPTRTRRPSARFKDMEDEDGVFKMNKIFSN